MMKILSTHDHILRFRLDKDAPKSYRKRWLDFKQRCEWGEENTEMIVDSVLYYCKLNSNKILPYLHRSEGGIGGDNNKIHKQLRFRDCLVTTMVLEQDDDIVLYIYNALLNDQEEWTYEELDDLIEAFVKTANDYVEEECVKGCIEMVNKNANFLFS